MQGRRHGACGCVAVRSRVRTQRMRRMGGAVRGDDR